jgi:DNA-dependent RNA polymerase auxiliary subunit epsilon
MKHYFNTQKFPYFTFNSKWEKPIKTVTRSLPIDMLTDDTAHMLREVDFNILNVRQLSSKHNQAEGETKTTNIPLCLATMKRSPKSQEKFKLTALCHSHQVQRVQSTEYLDSMP